MMVRLTVIIFFQFRQGQGRGKEQGLCWAIWGRKAEVKKKSINILTFFCFLLSVMCYVLCVLCYVGHSAPSSPRRQPLLHLDSKIAFVLHKDQGLCICTFVLHKDQESASTFIIYVEKVISNCWDLLSPLLPFTFGEERAGEGKLTKSLFNAWEISF